jgi:hypothetical protein
MFSGVLAIVFLVLGLVLGIAYSRLVIRHYPDVGRKTAYMATVAVFLALLGILYLVISVRAGVNAAITRYSIQMEQYVKDNHRDNEFVQNGLDLKEVNDDLSQVSRIIEEFKLILPTYQELGASEPIYNLIVNYAINELQNNLTVLNSANVVKVFVGKNKVLTVASMSSGLQETAIGLVNTISLIISAVALAAFMIYIIYSLLVARKAKKIRETLTTANQLPS